MEVIEHTYPVAWDDCDMDWDNPDPGNTNYVLALRSALMERFALVGAGSLNLQYLAKMPLKFAHMRYEFLTYLRNALRELAPYYLDVDDFNYEKDNYTTFPYYHTYARLNSYPGCHICELPPRGMPSAAYAEFFRQAKGFLDKLRYREAKWQTDCTWQSWYWPSINSSASDSKRREELQKKYPAPFWYKENEKGSFYGEIDQALLYADSAGKAVKNALQCGFIITAEFGVQSTVYRRSLSVSFDAGREKYRANSIQSGSPRFFNDKQIACRLCAVMRKIDTSTIYAFDDLGSTMKWGFNRLDAVPAHAEYVADKGAKIPGTPGRVPQPPLGRMQYCGFTAIPFVDYAVKDGFKFFSN